MSLRKTDNYSGRDQFQVLSPLQKLLSLNARLAKVVASKWKQHNQLATLKNPNRRETGFWYDGFLYKILEFLSQNSIEWA